MYSHEEDSDTIDIFFVQLPTYVTMVVIIFAIGVDIYVILHYKCVFRYCK